MPEETRYFTLSGNVPNGGIPPGRTLASLAGLPLPPPPGFGHCVFSGGLGLPPPYSAPEHHGHGRGHQPYQPYQPYYPTLHPGPPPPAPPAAPVSNPARFEPPGQYLDGHMLQGGDWSYITPQEHTTIHFLVDGTRPCDAPQGYYPHQFTFTKHKVPTMMTMKDLIKGLGQHGITEMEELGNNRFTAGLTITRGSERAKMTLAELGWTQKRSDAAPIWVLVKKK